MPCGDGVRRWRETVPLGGMTLGGITLQQIAASVLCFKNDNAVDVLKKKKVSG